MPKKQAAERLAQNHKQFDPRIFGTLTEVGVDVDKAKMPVCVCDINDLVPSGMFLEPEGLTKAGLLLVPKGREVTAPLIAHLRGFVEYESIEHTITVTTSANQAVVAGA
jgi:hypothetical protein